MELRTGTLAPWRRLKEVVYSLSNYNQNVMQGLWTDVGYKATKKLKENGVEWFGFFIFPVVGTYTCVTHNRLLRHTGASPR